MPRRAGRVCYQCRACRHQAALTTTRQTGYITAVVAAVIMPWKILSSTHGHILIWLVGYSALLGAVTGTLIVDYYHIRRWVIGQPLLLLARLEPHRGGRLPDRGSAVPAGLSARLAAADLSAPRAVFTHLYRYAWFVALGLSAAAYAVGMRLAARRAGSGRGISAAALTRRMRLSPVSFPCSPMRGLARTARGARTFLRGVWSCAGRRAGGGA